MVLSVVSAPGAVRVLADALGGRWDVATYLPVVGHVPYGVCGCLGGGMFVEVWEPLVCDHCMVFCVRPVAYIPGTNPVVMGVAWKLLNAPNSVPEYSCFSQKCWAVWGLRDD